MMRVGAGLRLASAFFETPKGRPETVSSVFELHVEDFHRACRFLGGSLDILARHQDPRRQLSQKIYGHISEHIDGFLKRVSSASPHFHDFIKQTRFGFIANARPNAYSWKADGRYYVGITSGLMHLFFDTCFNALSDNTCFSFVPDGQENVKSKKISKQKLGRYFHSESPLDIAYHIPDIPDNSIRSAMALHLVELQILFAFMHEIGHCLMGHFEIKDDVDFICEISETENSGVPYNEALVMEFQADNVALLFLLHYLLSEQERMDGKSSDLFYMMSVAIDLAFWIFSKGPVEKLQQRKIGSHPHPQHRIAYKTWRMLEIDERLPIRSEQLSGFGLENSVAKLMIQGSQALAADWTKAGLAPRGWSIFKKPLTAAKLITEVANFLGKNAEASVDRFTPVVKFPVLYSALPYFYSESDDQI